MSNQASRTSTPTTLTIGIVPLTDCAPIVAAAELGFYAEEGLDVRLTREPSWAGLRDKLAFGLLDAAQLLAPMLPAMALGLTGAGRHPVVSALGLGTGGNAITLGAPLVAELDEPLATDQPVDASVLRPVIERRFDDGRPPLTFGVVFPFSMHHYLLRRWLGAGGIDVNAEVTLKVVPPPQVADQLELGALDGFCVGEPWNSVAVQRGVGRTVVAGVELMPEAPEKVLAVGAAFAEEQRTTHAALIRATLRGCRWCGESANVDRLAALLAPHVSVDVAELLPALRERLPVNRQTDRPVPGMYRPLDVEHNRPRPDHAGLLLDLMNEAGQLDDPRDELPSAEQLLRPDLFDDAVRKLDVGDALSV
ncbi:MAG: CmpA/NrtA family ABC transporter substrate-binding protein [Planctomycetota bacterium]